jgi:hypothetical protein
MHAVELYDALEGVRAAVDRTATDLESQSWSLNTSLLDPYIKTLYGLGKRLAALETALVDTYGNGYEAGFVNAIKQAAALAKEREERLGRYADGHIGGVAVLSDDILALIKQE